MNKSAKAYDVFNTHAEKYTELYFDVSAYYDGLDFFISNLPNPDTAQILELGCGPGNVTHYISRTIPPAHILATDLAPKMLEVANSKNPNVDFLLMDARKPKSLKRTFDGIICAFITPYLNDLELQTLCSDLCDILDSSGLIYISTMEGDYENSKIQLPSSGEGPGIWIHYYSENTITKYLIELGFNILHVSKVNHPVPYAESQNDVILIAQKR